MKTEKQLDREIAESNLGMTVTADTSESVELTKEVLPPCPHVDDHALRRVLQRVSVVLFVSAALHMLLRFVFA